MSSRSKSATKSDRKASEIKASSNLVRSVVNTSNVARNQPVLFKKGLLLILALAGAYVTNNYFGSLLAVICFIVIFFGNDIMNTAIAEYKKSQQINKELNDRNLAKEKEIEDAKVREEQKKQIATNKVNEFIKSNGDHTQYCECDTTLIDGSRVFLPTWAFNNPIYNPSVQTPCYTLSTKGIIKKHTHNVLFWGYYENNMGESALSF